MRKLGIIGGAGPLASALLYRMIVEKCYEKSSEVPEIIIVNYLFTRGLGLGESAKYERIIVEEIQHCLHLLAKAGAEYSVISCNTLHAFLEKVDTVSMTLLHMPNLVCHEIVKEKKEGVLVLGTPTTRKMKLYESSSFSTVFPNQENQKKIDFIIDRVLEGKVVKKDSKTLQEIVDESLKRDSFQGVVLGCTELSVLHHAFPLQCTNISIFDSLKVLSHESLNVLDKK